MRNENTIKHASLENHAGGDTVAEIHVARMISHKVSETPARALKIDVLAERLGCSRRQVFRMIEKGAITAIKLGSRSTRVSEAELERFIHEGSRRS